MKRDDLPNMHSFWKSLICALVVGLVSVGTLLMVFLAIWPLLSHQFTWLEALGLAACCFCVIVPLQYLTRPGGRWDIWR